MNNRFLTTKMAMVVLILSVLPLAASAQQRWSIVPMLGLVDNNGGSNAAYLLAPDIAIKFDNYSGWGGAKIRYGFRFSYEGSRLLVNAGLQRQYFTTGHGIRHRIEGFTAGSYRWIGKGRDFGFRVTSFPVDIHLKLRKNWRLIGGLAVSRYSPNENLSEFTTFQDAPKITPLYNHYLPELYRRRWMAGYRLGLGYEYRRFVLEAVYQLEFGSLTDDLVYEGQTYPVHTEVRYLSLMLGYRIPLGKAPQKAAPPAGEYYAPQ